MKTIAVLLFAFAVLAFPIVSQAAATAAQVDAWKAEFPAAAPADSAQLRQMIMGYQQLVNKVTAKPGKTLVLLKDKLTHDQLTTNSLLHPSKQNPKVTPVMQADAAEASKWLNEKFAPFLARAPT